jgi:hypothetical protein
VFAQPSNESGFVPGAEDPEAAMLTNLRPLLRLFI